MKTHNLKTWPEYFEKVVDGSKTFEYRLNDREFETGDLLVLHEWSQQDGYTGRSTRRKAGYVFHIPDSAFCVIGLLPAAMETHVLLAATNSGSVTLEGECCQMKVGDEMCLLTFDELRTVAILAYYALATWKRIQPEVEVGR